MIRVVTALSVLFVWGIMDAFRFRQITKRVEKLEVLAERNVAARDNIYFLLRELRADTPKVNRVYPADKGRG